MKKIVLVCLSFMMVFVSLLSDVQAYSLLDVSVTGKQYYDKAYEVLDIVNEERSAEGLEPLVMDEDLLETAMERAVETSLYFSHTRPDKTSCFSACSKMYGENIAAGNSTASATMNQWMNSSGHKANILGSNYESIGIGCFQNGSIYYWVQCFGISDIDEAEESDAVKEYTGSVSIADDLVDLYAYSIGSDQTYNGYYLVGESGYLRYGIINQGWDSVYSLGVSDDYCFESSDTDVVTINDEGEYIATGEGSAVLTVSLKADSTKYYSIDIEVRREDLSDGYCYTYTGGEIKPSMKVYYTSSRLLEEGKDYEVIYLDNIDVGTATMVISGLGKYKGTVVQEFEIVKANGSLSFENDYVSKKTTDDTFVNPITVKGDGDVSYTSSNTAVATVDQTGKVTIKGAGNVTITATLSEGQNYKGANNYYTLVVSAVSLSNADMSLDTSIFTYNGKSHCPTPTVTLDGQTLKKDSDYTVSYKNNVNAGSATVVIKGINKYKGETTKTYLINKADSSLSFNSNTLTKKVSDSSFTNTLTIIGDGEVSYSSSDCSVATIDENGKVAIKGVGTTTITAYMNEGDNYKSNSTSYVLNVNPDSLKNASVTLSSSSYTYNGNAKCPSVTVKINGKTLTKNIDYKVSYKNNINAGTGSVVISGMNNYTGEVSKTFKINKAALTISCNNYSYTGKQIKPSIVVKAGNKTLSKSQYTVKYGTNKNIGKGSVTVTAKNTNYKATVKYFKINPKKMSISSLKSTSKGKLTVKYKKITGSVTGYQISYSTSSTRGFKTVTVSSKTLSKTISGLKSKKYYYVKIRAYKTVSGTKYYGTWSSVKKIKTK